jgi:hypothetical protein
MSREQAQVRLNLASVWPEQGQVKLTWSIDHWNRSSLVQSQMVKFPLPTNRGTPFTAGMDDSKSA